MHIERLTHLAVTGHSLAGREVGSAGMFVLSDLARGITGEIMHVDCGYTIMGSPGRAIEKVKRMFVDKVSAHSPETAKALLEDQDIRSL